MTNRLYIVAAKRTAIGSFQGSLSPKSAIDLGVIAANAVLKQVQIHPEDIDEVIVGNVFSAGLGMGIGRQISIGAGLSTDIPAYTLNMIGGSGMKVIMDACAHIKAGDADVILAVGTESMSNVGFLHSSTLRRGKKIGHILSQDIILSDGLTDDFSEIHIGITAENIATQYCISRFHQDQFALESHKKAQRAKENNLFNEEIVPIQLSHGNGITLFTDDEQVCKEVSMPQLQKLKPSFFPEGSVTQGNVSDLNDGAAAIIIVSEEALERHKLIPLAEIISYGQGGVAPDVMGLGSVPAIAQALERSDLRLSDIERIELDEVFAAQSIGVLHELSDQHDCDYNQLMAITNPTGGTIALGHPLGCTGSRIITTLLYGLHRDKQTFGLASLCVGGGMGCAIIIRAL